MSIRAKAVNRKGAKGDPLFITKSQLAHAMGNVAPATLDDWVKEGTFPPPHSRPGERTAVWLKRHFDAYVASGRWPEEAFRCEN